LVNWPARSEVSAVGLFRKLAGQFRDCASVIVERGPLSMI
jgi:hypothetical protein